MEEKNCNEQKRASVGVLFEEVASLICRKLCSDLPKGRRKYVDYAFAERSAI